MFRLPHEISLLKCISWGYRINFNVVKNQKVIHRLKAKKLLGIDEAKLTSFQTCTALQFFRKMKSFLVYDYVMI